MDNLQLQRIIEDRGDKTEYQIYGHQNLPDSELNQIIHKKSLWEDAGVVIRHNTTYKLVKIVAADGWQDAPD